MARDPIYFADIPEPPPEAPPRQLFEYAATASFVLTVPKEAWRHSAYAQVRRVVERYLEDWCPEVLEEMR